MKKLLSILLSLVLVIGLSPLTAFAANGPSPAYEEYEGGERGYFASIYAMAPDSNGNYFGEWFQPLGQSYPIFANNAADNSALAGVTYDRDNNQLTLDGTKSIPTVRLTANCMGDDFSIKVIGTVRLAQIVISGSRYGGNLKIVGDGELLVNESKKFPSAIVMNAYETPGTLTFGQNVKVGLWAESGYVAETEQSTNDSAAAAYVFENGASYSVNKSDYGYETPRKVNGIYLSDPDENRWGGYLCTSKDDPTGFYVTGTEEDGNGKTLHTLGRYVYVPKYNAYVRYYSFGDRYSNGYEYVFTEDEWNAQTTYTPKTTISSDPNTIDYYDPDDPEANYVTDQVQRASDPDGIYGYSSYTKSQNNVVYERGYNITRYVYSSQHGKYVEDTTFTPIEVTEDNFCEPEWSIVYAEVPVSLEWTGSVVQGEYEILTDGKGGYYFSDYQGNYYTYDTNDGVDIYGDFYAYLNKADGVNADAIENVYDYVKVDGQYNYRINLTEFFYNMDSGDVHQHNLTQINAKAPTCSKPGNKPYYFCTSCHKYFSDNAGTVETTEAAQSIPATNNHVSDKGTLTKAATYTATGVKTYKCATCGKVLRTQTIPKLAKKANPIAATPLKPSVKFSKLKKKNQSVAISKALKVTGAKGNLSYAKAGGNKKISVAKSGKITIKKGLKKGTYKIKIKVTASGNAAYKAGSKTVTVAITVK